MFLRLLHQNGADERVSVNHPQTGSVIPPINFHENLILRPYESGSVLVNAPTMNLTFNKDIPVKVIETSAYTVELTLSGTVALTKRDKVVSGVDYNPSTHKLSKTLAWNYHWEWSYFTAEINLGIKYDKDSKTWKGSISHGFADHLEIAGGELTASSSEPGVLTYSHDLQTIRGTSSNGQWRYAGKMGFEIKLTLNPGFRPPAEPVPVLAPQPVTQSMLSRLMDLINSGAIPWKVFATSAAALSFLGLLVYAGWLVFLL